MKYTVGEYPKEGSGEYGIFCSVSRTWVLFGTQEEMNGRCEQLNKTKIINLQEYNRQKMIERILKRGE